jgi:hypothetical protein
MSSAETGLRPPYLILALSAVLCVAVAVSSLDLDGDESAAVESGVGSEARTVAAGAHGVEIAGPIDTSIRIAATESVEIEAADSLRPRVSTELRDGLLRLSFDGELPPKARFKARIALRRVDALHIAGNGNAEITGLENGPLAITIDGSGDVEARGSVDRVEITVRGSGDVDLNTLATRDPTVQIQGSGNVELGEIINGTARVDIRGSGNVSMTGKVERLDATLAGSGDLDASGLDAQDAHVEIRGDGDAELLVRRTLEVVRQSGQGVVTNSGEAVATQTGKRRD